MLTWRRSRVMCAAVGAHQSPTPQPSQRPQTTNIKRAREPLPCSSRNAAQGAHHTPKSHLSQTVQTTNIQKRHRTQHVRLGTPLQARTSHPKHASRHPKQRIDPVASKYVSQACPEISKRGGITVDSVKMCFPSLS
jgi:hypothetical protein